MKRTPLRTAALSIAAVVILAGCGAGTSTSSSASGSAATASKVSFCQDNAMLDKATASAKTGPELVKDLTANQSTIAHFGKVAPADVTDRAQILVLGANAAIKSNNGDAFATARFVSVSNAINAYCNQKADGSPASPVT